MPLVFENPASNSWPPLWNADMAGKIAPGRTWTGGRIIIGRNDGSVAVEVLADTKGMVGPKLMAGNLNLFTQASDGIPQRVLQVVYGNVSPTPPVNPPNGIPPLASVPSLPGVPQAPASLPPTGL